MAGRVPDSVRRLGGKVIRVKHPLRESPAGSVGVGDEQRVIRRHLGMQRGHRAACLRLRNAAVSLWKRVSACFGIGGGDFQIASGYSGIRRRDFKIGRGLFGIAGGGFGRSRGYSEIGRGDFEIGRSLFRIGVGGFEISRGLFGIGGGDFEIGRACFGIGGGGFRIGRACSE